MENFNVAINSWIPCINKQGKNKEVSLIELFMDESLVDFRGSSVERYCLIKFCGAIAQSSHKNQPKDPSQWKNIRKSYALNVVEYLKENIALFYMDGEFPFLQFNPETEGDINDNYFRKNYSLEHNQIKCELRDDYIRNNTVITSQSLLRIDYSMGKTIIDLIVHQMFSLPATAVVYKPEKTSGKGAYHHASRSLMYENSTKGNINIYATTTNIIDSIWYNMKFGQDFGKPSWETRFNYNISYLARLVPLTARIKISPDLRTMYYFKGLEYPNNIGDKQYHIPAIEKYSYRDPITGKSQSKDVQRPMSTSHSGKWWRDFEAITCEIEGSANTNVFDFCKINEVDTLKIHTVGVIFKLGQFGAMNIEKINSSTYDCENPKKIKSDIFREMYIQCVVESKQVSDKLYGAIKQAITQGDNNPKKQNAKQAKELNNKLSVFLDAFNNELDYQSNHIFSYEPETGNEEWRKVMRNAIGNVVTLIEKKYGLVTAHEVSKHMVITKEI